MLVCAVNVQSEDPAAKALYGAMLRYLSGEEFRPPVELKAAWLLDLMEKNQKVEVDFTTDECYDAGGRIEV